MRRLMLSILIITFLFGISSAKEYTVRKGLKASTWNEFMKGLTETDLRLNYDDESGHFLLYVDSPVFPIAIELKDDIRETLLGYIKKYKEWNSKASSKGIELEKVIGKISAKVYFRYGDEWFIDYYTTIQVKFFSQNPQRHQLIIGFGKLTSSSNQYISRTPDTLYLWWRNAIALENAIGNQAKAKYIKEIEKKKNIQDEFK